MCFALFAWLVQAALLAGIGMQSSWSVGRDWSAFKCLDTNVILQTAIF